MQETLTELMVGGAAVTVISDVPNFVESCVLFAVMVSDPDAGTDAGAV